jgi:hypothetical protein
MAHVESHLSIEDLAARYRACEDAGTARQVGGYTLGEIDVERCPSR